jgi:hypothetical protein
MRPAGLLLIEMSKKHLLRLGAILRAISSNSSNSSQVVVAECGPVKFKDKATAREASKHVCRLSKQGIKVSPRRASMNEARASSIL